MSTALDACSVAPISSVAVQLDDIPWQFAVQNGDKIAAFWELKQKTHPHFHDGQVHVMTSWEIRGDQTNGPAFVGNVRRTNFASFLYWKTFATRSQKEVDFSGGAALITRDGAVLMTLTGDQTIVPGILEFPSGFVDVTDFEDHRLNLDRHVEREVTEELLITKEELDGPKSRLISAADGVVQALSIFTIDSTGIEFVERWRAKARAVKSEIRDVVPIYRPSQLANFPVQRHVEAAVSHILSDYPSGA